LPPIQRQASLGGESPTERKLARIDGEKSDAGTINQNGSQKTVVFVLKYD
jgi:hypothetical protein